MGSVTSVSVFVTRPIKHSGLVGLYYFLVLASCVVVSIQFGYLQFFGVHTVSHTNINPWRAGDLKTSEIYDLCPRGTMLHAPAYERREVIIKDITLDNGTVVKEEVVTVVDNKPSFCFNTSLDYELPSSLFGKLNVSNASCTCVPRAQGMIIEGPTILVPTAYLLNRGAGSSHDASAVGSMASMASGSDFEGSASSGTTDPRGMEHWEGQFTVGLEDQVFGIAHGLWIERAQELSPNVVVHEDPAKFVGNPPTDIVDAKGNVVMSFEAHYPIQMTIRQMLTFMGEDLDRRQDTSLGISPPSRVSGFPITAIMTYENRRPWHLGPVSIFDIKVTIKFRRVPDSWGFLPPLMLDRDKGYVERTGLKINFSPKGVLYYWSVASVMQALVELFVLTSVSKTIVRLLCDLWRKKEDATEQNNHREEKSQRDALPSARSVNETITMEHGPGSCDDESALDSLGKPLNNGGQVQPSVQIPPEGHKVAHASARRSESRLSEASSMGSIQ